MKAKQIKRFKKELENSRLMPWRNTKELTSLLVDSMNEIVQEQGALWLKEFHDLLKEYFQWLYDNKRILQSHSIGEEIKRREYCLERTLTEEEKKEEKETLKRSISANLDGVAEGYLLKVYQAKKPFAIKRNVEILRDYFKCGKLDSIHFVHLEFKDPYKATKENYMLLLREAKRIEKIVNAIIMPSSLRRRIKNLTRKYDVQPEDYELNKLKKIDFNKLNIFDAREVYHKVRSVYNELILELRNTKVAYSSLEKAVEFLEKYLDFNSIVIGRKFYLPVITPVSKRRSKK